MRISSAASFLLATTFISTLTLTPALMAKTIVGKVDVQNAKAHPLKRVEPKYPISAARQSREGWVRMSFVVDEQGDVHNAFITDSSGHKDFEREALKAVKRWQYQPAIVNGEPVVQCENAVQLDFMLSGHKQGARTKFIAKYKKANDLLDQGDLAAAREKIDDIHDDKLWNFYEHVWYSLLEARYASMVGDEDRVYHYDKKLVRKSVKEHLPEDTYLRALERVYLYELNHMLLAKANKSYQKMLELESGQMLAESYRDEQTQVEAFIHNDKLIKVQGQVGERDFWHHTLARKDFSLMNVQGSLDKVEIRCDKSHREFDFAPDSTWDIPDSWGECQIYIHGSQGSEFDLIEHPFNS